MMLPASRAGSLIGSVEETRQSVTSISRFAEGKEDRGAAAASRRRAPRTFSDEVLRAVTLWALASDHHGAIAREARTAAARKRRVMTVSPRIRAKRGIAAAE